MMRADETDVHLSHDGRPRSKVSISRHVAQLTRLAGPLAVAQLSFVAMGVTDTVLLASLGPDVLAAGGLSNNLAMSGGIVLQGIMQAASTLIAQAKGAGRQTGDILITAFALALALALVQFSWLTFAPDVLQALGEPADVVSNVGRYVSVSRWGAIGSVVGVGFMRAVLPNFDRGRTLLWTSLGAATLNGALNYSLIHGVGPFPAMGMIGSALATVVTLSCMTLTLVVLTFHQLIAPCLRQGRFRLALLRDLLAIGLPVGGTYGVETLLFLTVGLLMGLLGPATLAAHQIVQNIAYVCFMLPLALGQAANIRVGHFVGKADIAEARRAGIVAIVVSMACMSVTGIVMAAAPGFLVSLYIAPDRPDAITVAKTAAAILMVAAFFQIADAVQTVAAGALRGLKDTRIPFVIATVGYWGVGFVVATGLGIGAGLGAVGLWSGLATGLSFVAVLMTWRFINLSGLRSAP